MNVFRELGKFCKGKKNSNLSSQCSGNNFGKKIFIRNEFKIKRKNTKLQAKFVRKEKDNRNK